MKSRSRNRLQACGTGDRSLRQLLQRMSLAGGVSNQRKRRKPAEEPKKKISGPRPKKNGQGWRDGESNESNEDILRDIHKPVAQSDLRLTAGMSLYSSTQK